MCIRDSPNIEHKQISYNNLNTSYIFREGDKVMHIMNDYERKVYTGKLDDLIYNETGLFNGEVGVIVKIDPDKEELIVKYDDNRYVIYQKKDLDLLELAYVQTVHKSPVSYTHLDVYKRQGVGRIYCARIVYCK